MSKPAGRRPQPKAAKASAARRIQPAAPRWRSQRRWIGWGAAGTAIVAAVAIIAVANSGASNAPATNATRVAALAPNGSFTTTSGANQTVSALRGQPTLLWFVTTWCSSCQAGTQAMAAQIGTFAAHHVRVVELELAGDLGQSGPGITDFGRQLAGAGYHNPDWTFGVAGPALTTTYDPNGYLDVYYLLDAAGHIAYVNSSPGATMGQLLSEVAKVGSHA
jgi:thiol-disulfide isomerase/thioredoxin